MSWAKRSMARPASFTRKSPIAMTAESAAPSRGSRPSRASSPRPAPGHVADVEGQSADRHQHDEQLAQSGQHPVGQDLGGKPGGDHHAPDGELGPRSNSTLTRMAKPKLAPSVAVKTTVWVKKPRPDGRGGHEERRPQQNSEATAALAVGRHCRHVYRFYPETRVAKATASRCLAPIAIMPRPFGTG